MWYLRHRRDLVCWQLMNRFWLMLIRNIFVIFLILNYLFFLGMFSFLFCFLLFFFFLLCCFSGLILFFFLRGMTWGVLGLLRIDLFGWRELRWRNVLWDVGMRHWMIGCSRTVRSGAVLQIDFVQIDVADYR